MMQCRFSSSLTIIWQISTAAGSIKSFPIAWGFLHLAIQGCKIRCLLCFLMYCRDVSQSYRLLDVFFFLSLKINPYFYLHAPVELSVEFICFSASTDKIFKHSVHCGLVSLYSIKPYFMYKSSNLVSFFHAGLFCIYLLSWDTASCI